MSMQAVKYQPESKQRISTKIYLGGGTADPQRISAEQWYRYAETSLFPDQGNRLCWSWITMLHSFTHIELSTGELDLGVPIYKYGEISQAHTFAFTRSIGTS